MRKIRIALTKGRLLEESIALFERAGIECESLRHPGRRLILPIADGEMEAVLAKAADVITYVENGVCDIGIVGKDTIMECATGLYEIMDLGFGRCRFAVAGPKERTLADGKYRRAATKYLTVAGNYFERKKMDVELIKIEGSVKLAPLLDLSDVIVDIVETGSTLKANGLEVYETVAEISARLVVNVASLKLRKSEIDAFTRKIEAVLKA